MNNNVKENVKKCLALGVAHYAAHVAFIDYRFGTAVRGKN
jgi:hypothetical protein